ALTATLETNGSPAKLSLIAERKEISADGRDLSVVQVQVLDAQNRLVPIAGSPIEFHLSGNGSLIGVGNGNPSSHEADKADRRHAFNGLCMAIVASIRQPGELRLEATSPGLAPAVIETIIYGVAYYPEFMPYDRLDRDVELMQKAGITVVRVGESTWSTWEPHDGDFQFAWMQRVLDRLHAAGIKAILGTPTYS